MERRSKFIADVNVEKAIVDFLLADGYDVKWVPDFDCEILDEDLVKLANRERRIIITNDKDFGELTFLQRRLSSGVILIRVKGQITSEKVKLVGKLLKAYGDKLLNHFVVVSKTKFRFIPMEGIR